MIKWLCTNQIILKIWNMRLIKIVMRRYITNIRRSMKTMVSIQITTK